MLHYNPFEAFEIYRLGSYIICGRQLSGKAANVVSGKDSCVWGENSLGQEMNTNGQKTRAFGPFRATPSHFEPFRLMEKIHCHPIPNRSSTGTSSGWYVAKVARRLPLLWRLLGRQQQLSQNFCPVAKRLSVELPPARAFHPRHRNSYYRIRCNFCFCSMPRAACHGTLLFMSLNCRNWAARSVDSKSKREKWTQSKSTHFDVRAAPNILTCNSSSSQKPRAVAAADAV